MGPVSTTQVVLYCMVVHWYGKGSSRLPVCPISMQFLVASVRLVIVGPVWTRMRPRGDKL